MSAAPSYFAELSAAQDALVFLLVKITVILAVVWLLNAGLAGANPRWRRLLWRTCAVGIMLLFAASALPPLASWPLLLGEPISVDAAPQIAKAPDAAAPPAEPLDAPHPTATQLLGTTLQPAAAGSQVASDSRGLPTWPGWFGMIWAAGAALIVLQTLAGMRRLAHIRRRAAGVPPCVSDQAAEISRKLGRRRNLAVLQSTEIASPCVMGVRRPTVLLPAMQCDPAFSHELPAILAHEIAHVRGGDCAWNLLVHFVATACWFHPLIWRMRAVHVAACDAVCDSIAADHVGNVAEYGQTLARLALRVCSPPIVAGMTMAHSSHVRRRIEALHRRVYPTGLRRGPKFIAVAVGLTMFAFLGTLTITSAQAEPRQAKPAQQASAPAPDEEQPKTVAILIQVSDEAGQPLADAQIRFEGQTHTPHDGRVVEEAFKYRLTTDERGIARFELPPQAEVQSLSMTCEKPNRVPQHYIWRSRNSAIELPQRLDLSLAPGKSISGIVKDAHGLAVTGAEIDLSMRVTWPRLANHAFNGATLKTDAQGRWSWNGAPADLRDVTIYVTHPDFLKEIGQRLAEEHHTTILERGVSLSGRVTDAEGRPIQDAVVREGHATSRRPTATTDQDGRFVLEYLRSGKTLLTVQANSFAPDLRQVTAAEGADAVDFKLEPGLTMRVRVVDVEGRGVPGATFCTNKWRDYQCLEMRVTTDSQGRAEWHSAPADAVLCDVFKQGYMSTRRAPVTASDEETVLTLYPPLVITGTVTDVVTGAPVHMFRVRQGQIPIGGKDLYWGLDAGTPFTGDTYSYRFDEPLVNGHFLRVEAPGYKPADSRAFQWNEGAQPFDFRLQPAPGPSGVVLLPDGKPAAGAEVAVTTRDSHLSFSAGYLPGDATGEIVKTDADGRFTLLPRLDNDAYLLLVVHDAGYAEITGENFAKSNRLTLRPWGRIEGRVLLGREPDVDREVCFSPDTGNDSWGFVFGYGYTTKTDDDGRFHFDRVISGPGQIGRVEITQSGNGGSLHTPGWWTPVEVPPSGTVSPMIGGTGRPVTGLVKCERATDEDFDWIENEPAVIDLIGASAKAPVGQPFRAAANFDKSGRFHIADVPAGKYKLTVRVDNPRGLDPRAGRRDVGRAQLEFVVPPMTDNRSDERLDLGTITVK
jgi:beta-lactamase regulating signal transducer with metallopeptidase domain/uncharacterized GH25 family protein